MLAQTVAGVYVCATAYAVFGMGCETSGFSEGLYASRRHGPEETGFCFLVMQETLGQQSRLSLMHKWIVLFMHQMLQVSSQKHMCVHLYAMAACSVCHALCCTGCVHTGRAQCWCDGLGVPLVQRETGFHYMLSVGSQGR